MSIKDRLNKVLNRYPALTVTVIVLLFMLSFNWLNNSGDFQGYLAGGVLVIWIIYAIKNNFFDR
jgi:hypothetical protein